MKSHRCGILVFHEFTVYYVHKTDFCLTNYINSSKTLWTQRKKNLPNPTPLLRVIFCGKQLNYKLWETCEKDGVLRFIPPRTSAGWHHQCAVVFVSCTSPPCTSQHSLTKVTEATRCRRQKHSYKTITNLSHKIMQLYMNTFPWKYCDDRILFVSSGIILARNSPALSTWSTCSLILKLIKFGRRVCWTKDAITVGDVS